MFSKLFKWSAREYSSLPWRKKRTLYRTLVSEIMLQQTTVSTVFNKYEGFIEQFPSIESIANASDEELTIAWKGLGYYRRCRNLKKACEYFRSNHSGRIPKKFEELIAAPGIGDYTANALIGIGRDQKALAVDANLERVISRLYGIEIYKGPKLIKNIYQQFNEGKLFKSFKGSYRELNESLMDLGRVFCTSRKASCELCPLSSKCVAFENKKQNILPLKKDIQKEKPIDIDLLRVVVLKGKKILAYKKSESEWLSGQWEVPTFTLKVNDLKQYPVLKSEIKTASLKNYKTTITKYKFTNHILETTYTKFLKLESNPKYQFVNFDLEGGNFSTATLKALKKREGQ